MNITYERLADSNKPMPEPKQERYYLLRQQERKHPLRRDVYLTKGLFMTVFPSSAGLFTEAELNDLPEEFQESYVAIRETKLLKELELTNHD